MGHIVPHLDLKYLICLEYTVTRTIGYVVGFPQGWYAQTIMHIRPLLPFSFTQHHLPITVLSVTDSYIQPAIV